MPRGPVRGRATARQAVESISISRAESVALLGHLSAVARHLVARKGEAIDYVAEKLLAEETLGGERLLDLICNERFLG